jgi:hypothetical protein
MLIIFYYINELLNIYIYNVFHGKELKFNMNVHFLDWKFKYFSK